MLNKAEIVKEFGKNEQDTGSVEVQIALLTERDALENANIIKKLRRQLRTLEAND